MSWKAGWMVMFLSGFVSGVFAQPISNEQLKQWDVEQFKRLESGHRNPVEIPEKIIASSSKPSIYLINAYTVLGIVNKNKGFYATALNFHLKAKATAERMGDKGRLSACLNNIGILYLLQDNHAKAIDFFEQSLHLEEQLNNDAQRSIRLYNLGDAYKKANRLDEAMGFYTTSLLIERRIQNPIGIQYALLGQADVYERLHRLSDLTQTIEQVDVAKLDVEGAITYWKTCAKWNHLRKRFSDEKACLDRAETLALKHDFQSELSEIYRAKAVLLHDEGNDSQAVLWYEKHLLLYQKLQSNLVKNQLEDLNHRHELENKELQIAYLKKQQALLQQNLEIQQKLRQFDTKILVFSIVSLLGIVGVIVVGIRKLTKQVEHE